MNVCTAKQMHTSVDSNITDEDKLDQEIVKKLRKIGDEFDENASFKMELSLMMNDCIKAAPFKHIKEKLGDLASVIDVMKWIE